MILFPASCVKEEYPSEGNDVQSLGPSERAALNLGSKGGKCRRRGLLRYHDSAQSGKGTKKGMDLVMSARVFLFIVGREGTAAASQQTAWDRPP